MAQPFKDLKFLCTAVASDIRLVVVSRIKAMGGTYCNNLMSDVNVLVVGDRNTDKYRFSVEKRGDITFVRPASIVEMYEGWIDGRELGPEAGPDVLQSMKVFDGMTVCMSRVGNKQELAETVRANGGVSADSLTANTSCLVTQEKAGKRYDKALEWKIPVVDPKWIEDSVRRKAALDYQYYDITVLDRSSVGKGACLIWDQLAVRPGKRRAEEEIRQSKRNSASVNAWKAIVETGGDSPQNRNLGVSIKEEDESEEAAETEIFAGVSFEVSGFKRGQEQTLRKIIVGRGGQVGRKREHCDYIVIPHNVNKDYVQAGYKGMNVVTEWFIERSLYYNSVKEDLWGKPMVLNGRFPKAVVDKPLLSISGFSGAELMHLEKLIRALDGVVEFSEQLTRDVDGLIVNPGLLGLNQETCKQMFENELTHEILTDMEANKISLQSLRKKLVFSERNGIVVLSPNFLFEVMLQYGDEHQELNNGKWCLHYPKKENRLVRLLNSRQKKQKDWRLTGKASESSLNKGVEIETAGSKEVEDPGTQILYGGS